VYPYRWSLDSIFLEGFRAWIPQGFAPFNRWFWVPLIQVSDKGQPNTMMKGGAFAKTILGNEPTKPDYKYLYLSYHIITRNLEHHIFMVFVLMAHLAYLSS
jgi:hypothetical protein